MTPFIVVRILLFSTIIAALTSSLNSRSSISEHDGVCLQPSSASSVHVAEFRFDSAFVQSVLLFHYDEYYKKKKRHKLLESFLASVNVTKFVIRNKHSLFDRLPSDFDAVQVRSEFDMDQLIAHVSPNTHVRSVSPERRVTRTLKSTSQPSGEKAHYSKHNRNKDAVEKQGVDYEGENIAKLPPPPHGDGNFQKRKLFRAIPKQIIDLLHVRYMWDQGYTGAGVNVAVFDTGLEEGHAHFRNVVERVDFTDEKNADDRIGHGTFVCGVIASHSECLGIAPDVSLYVVKVFTDNQISYTSWFLDAFNYAIERKIRVLNLSIGGPDFMDMPFIDKVRQLTASNVIMVSGIGNDGPLYGTLNNPADQPDVIGVGGINADEQLAKFSSRGMTTWELPAGYGRVKPDIVTFSTHVRGSKKKRGCRALSGTSVASPLVAGCVALLLSSVIVDNNRERNNKNNSSSGNNNTWLNPASMKQILLASAERISAANMFEQGAGRLRLTEAHRLLRRYERQPGRAQASLLPSYVDLTECPYFWPYCTQPLYHSALPVIVNVTVLNALGAAGRIAQRPRWQPSVADNGHYVQMSIEYSARLWPWSGYIALRIGVSEAARGFDGTVSGLVTVEVQSDDDSNNNGNAKTTRLELFVKVRIVPTPPRAQRLLWDQFHNLRYPAGYFPRDDLKARNDPLDWNADHVHTNFRDMYAYLRRAGYFVEVLGAYFDCFDAGNYAALLVVDPEEEFHADEVRKLHDDVMRRGLSLVVMAEWYNASVIREAKFYDENTRAWWTPVTGGANVPALNELLAPFGIALGDHVLEGDFQVGKHRAYFGSGANIVRFPRAPGNYVLRRTFNDQGADFLAEMRNASLPAVQRSAVILGLAQYAAQDSAADGSAGRVVVYGDSGCIDSAHMKQDCFWLLSAVLEYAVHNIVYSALKETESKDEQADSADIDHDSNTKLPRRSSDDQLMHKYSKVLAEKTATRDVRCQLVNYDDDYPIANIPTASLPTKENLYNFLKLNETPADEISEPRAKNNENNRLATEAAPAAGIADDNDGGDGGVVDEPAGSRGRRRLKPTRQKDNGSGGRILNALTFPVCSTLVVFFVLVYFAIRLYRRSRGGRPRRSNLRRSSWLDKSKPFSRES